MIYLVTFNADTNAPIIATAYTDADEQQSHLNTLTNAGIPGLIFKGLTENDFYNLARMTADPIKVEYSNLALTEFEQKVLCAMLPEQDYAFIPTGMSNVPMIQKWLSDMGVIMSLESIKGIVGSLTKKGLLFSEVMEESNGKMIYFSYPNFDQNKENFFSLAKAVGFDTNNFLYM
jgi:hypothetical protein